MCSVILVHVHMPFRDTRSDKATAGRHRARFCVDGMTPCLLEGVISCILSFDIFPNEWHTGAWAIHDICGCHKIRLVHPRPDSSKRAAATQAIACRISEHALNADMSGTFRHSTAHNSNHKKYIITAVVEVLHRHNFTEDETGRQRPKLSVLMIPRTRSSRCNMTEHDSSHSYTFIKVAA